MNDKIVHDIDDLRWVRVFTPAHIPKHLVEQVRDRDFSVEDFYKYQEINCIMETDDGPILNPMSHLYVLADKENIIRGFLWLTIDALAKDICIHTYSVEKNYWEPGKAIRKVAAHVHEILTKANLNKVYWVTNCPRHIKRHGFKESKSILMEYSQDDEKNKKIQGEVIDG